ncbi:MAS2 [Candida oxycetoniae]|uniref:MAS2 n=1 Tax=Candida oxycetoniae TaxID=497107 RepID=A0AAI9SXP4_9ASCO|nr:MAS2 [Candida oxycetoniae]KAI3404912.2 MAS2 [Candida oxycetoniae]
MKRLYSPVVTHLSNGIRVVTDSTPGHFSALGAYIDGGSRYETSSTLGLSHIHDRLAFKSTRNYSGVEMMEQLQKLGGNYMSCAQRESMIYQASVFNKDVESMMDMLAETIQNPRFTEREFLEALQTADYEVQELEYKPQILLSEKLHEAAYKGGLGNSLFIKRERIPDLRRSDVVEYHREFFQPSNIVVAMVGVPEEKAIRMVEEKFNGSPSGKARERVGSYIGGEVCVPHQVPLYANQPELYHMQVAFQTTGLLDDDLYALATLQKLLGGGSSFSAGGPGKGMFSRLYTNVLNRCHYVESYYWARASQVSGGGDWGGGGAASQEPAQEFSVDEYGEQIGAVRGFGSAGAVSREGDEYR